MILSLGRTAAIIRVVNVNGNLGRMHHPHQLRRGSGIVAVHDVTVGVREGGGGFVGHAGEEGCHDDWRRDSLNDDGVISIYIYIILAGCWVL